MTTSIKDRINAVSDPRTRRAISDIWDAIRTDIAALFANTDSIDTASKSDAVINASTLTTGSTPENIATTAFQFRIDGVSELKAAVTAGTAPQAATVNVGTASGFFFGGLAVQVNTGGTISTLPASGDQVHATAAAALAAAQAITPTAGYVKIGYAVVAANEDSAWTGGTDNLTPASDCLTVSYSSVAATQSVTAASSQTLTA